MPRVHPTTKLGVYGQYDLNPEKAVTLYTKSKLQNKFYIKTPNWDVARLSFELKGIQSNREYEEVTKEQNRMRAHSYDQFRLNEKRLANAEKLLRLLWDDFVEVNDFLKDCEAKENESYETMDVEKKKQSHYHEEIGKLDSDLSFLNKFIHEYDKTVDEYKIFEEVLVQTIHTSVIFENINDLMKRCDSLLLAQVEISENEQQKIQEIECIRENLLESTKSALHIVTGLNNDLSRLQGRYMNALEECLKWEKSITVTKNFMTRNEMTTNCMLDAINHLYILISKRRGGPCKYVRGDVERQLDFIKEEAGIMQEIHSIAHKKLAKDDLSLIAEKGSIKTKPIIFPAKTKGFRKIAQ
ncbi:uncharacterized protein LOC120427318 [Culex pipiens pallens]|uniref:Coiled-coil domain-containing protein 42 homolog n=2 Tax=Culex pipiens TaxID=7175 RepID=A0A8D8CJR2_CULPI|nr:uncharacterized protein LOC120427318 [Culex pipiens pallens]